MTTWVVDLTDSDCAVETVADIFDTHDEVVGLFANAGYVQFATFLETDRKNWERHLSVNLAATFVVCQAFARQAVARVDARPASIVINSSSAAHQYSRALFSYSVTKAALVMMMKGMATELGSSGIRVNALMPGVIESPMTRSALDDDDVRTGLLDGTPIGRLGNPDDVAALTEFLLSDQAGYVTGAAIPLDGGQTLIGQPQWV